MKYFLFVFYRNKRENLFIQKFLQMNYTMHAIQASCISKKSNFIKLILNVEQMSHWECYLIIDISRREIMGETLRKDISNGVLT